MGGGWLLIASLLILIAAVLHQGALLMVGLLLFMVSGVTKLWARYALERLDYSHRLSAKRVFFGEEITLEISVANRKLLPLPWLDIEEELDKELTLLAGRTSPSYRPERSILHNPLSLGWYHKVTRLYPIRCTQRGYFTFGPARIRSGDFFGFRIQEKEVSDRVGLLVYPRIVPLARLGIPSREPFGELRVRRHLFEDPVRTVSTRDYVYGDPMKHIHWKASARVQRLQSKVFEHTTSIDLAVFLDVRTVQPPLWGSIPQILETAVIAAASIASYAKDKGYRLGLYVNQTYRHSDYMIKLPPSSHPEQFLHVLEALAQVTGTELVPIERLLRYEGPALPWVSTMVIVSAAPTEALLSAILSFRRAGRSVALVVVGGEKPELALDRLPVYHVPTEIPWEKVESIGVESVERQ
ncbi:MAG: DUF58 domain-containing protein [Chloroflexi bacterium]|nr:DUF58 domain-containing protein [Chloroflexota bacterium]